MDPLAITQQDYAELHLIVNNVWLMLACAFSFSGNMLIKCYKNQIHPF